MPLPPSTRGRTSRPDSMMAFKDLMALPPVAARRAARPASPFSHYMVGPSRICEGAPSPDPLATAGQGVGPIGDDRTRAGRQEPGGLDRFVDRPDHQLQAR